MVERGTVDLPGTFEICVVDWNGVMGFPGYAVSIIPGDDHLVRLVKE
jgi:hypothetical protein